MRSTLEIIEALKRRLSITSDYAVAKHLGIPRATVSNWRTGKYHPDTFTAAKIAELLGEPQIKIIALIEGERTKRPEQVKYWRELAKASIFATALIGGGILSAPAPAHSSPSAVQFTDDVYIMRRRRRGRFYDNLPKDPLLAVSQ